MGSHVVAHMSSHHDGAPGSPPRAGAGDAYVEVGRESKLDDLMAGAWWREGGRGFKLFSSARASGGRPRPARPGAAIGTAPPASR